MMIRVPLQVLAGLAIIFAAQTALSQDLRPGIIGNDDRVRLDERGPPWDAVGQVNVAGFRTGFDCTGTLVAPTLVVTAAHCVINPIAQKPYAFKDIHFLAAVRGSENKGHATAQCLHFLPNYHYLPLLQTDADADLWLNDCDTHSGSSGGPIFTRMDGIYRVAAIMLGVSERTYNIALSASKWLVLTRDAKCA
jgi:V8-like Glu-specific endopeptidase